MYEKAKGRCREYAHRRRTELQIKLKAVLNEAPPPSPKEVYARLGITESIAIYNFTELRRAIVTRYRQFRTEQFQARREAVRQEIRAIVRQLQTQGVCPSFPRVLSLLKGGSLGDWKLLGEFVNSARREVTANYSA